MRIALPSARPRRPACGRRLGQPPQLGPGRGHDVEAPVGLERPDECDALAVRRPDGVAVADAGREPAQAAPVQFHAEESRSPAARTRSDSRWVRTPERSPAGCPSLSAGGLRRSVWMRNSCASPTPFGCAEKTIQRDAVDAPVAAWVITTPSRNSAQAVAPIHADPRFLWRKRSIPPHQSTCGAVEVSSPHSGARFIPESAMTSCYDRFGPRPGREQ